MSLPQLQLAVLTLVLVASCTTLPEPADKSGSHSLPAATSGMLARFVDAEIDEPVSNRSYFHLVPRASDALRWRIALSRAATTSIDAQYFIWHDDASGALLMEQLLDAADRGVRVRLLVDEFHLSHGSTFKSKDIELAAIDYHPNIELKLFNPGEYRGGSLASLANLGTGFSHYNRRMHNKMMLVDGHMAVLGGRNIGNEYFGLGSDFNFVDADVLVSGAVLEEVSEAFDQYWNADIVYPAGSLRTVGEAEFEQMRRENFDYVLRQERRLAAFSDINPEAMLSALSGSLDSGEAFFFKDEPVPTGQEKQRLYDQLNEFAPPGSGELLATTPYLIPTGNFLDLLGQDEASGVEVSLLTNSLATNNQPTVHSHYKNYRKQILELGMELFELRAHPEGRLRQYVDTAPERGEHIALHMKSSVVDRERCFLGTLNFDPRSIDINTEDVIYIESEGFCATLADYLELLFDEQSAWRVTRAEDGSLRWSSSAGVESREPARSKSQRLMNYIYRILPEKQL